MSREQDHGGNISFEKKVQEKGKIVVPAWVHAFLIMKGLDSDKITSLPMIDPSYHPDEHPEHFSTCIIHQIPSPKE